MTMAETASAAIAADGVNCSQCVLIAFSEGLGLDRSLAVELAVVLGGGMGHTGQICGAVSGAYLVLGLKQHLNPTNALEIIEKTYALIKDFNHEFIKRNGSTNCTELLGYKPQPA